jgi:hypothetical protein
MNDAIQYLSELYSTLPDTHTNTGYTVADRQLVDFQKQTRKIVEKLQRALDDAQLKGGRTKWNSAYHALKSVWKDKEIAALGSQLDDIRKLVDTALLVSLRYVRYCVNSTNYDRP